MKILHFEQLESTNTTACRLAEQNAPEWTVISSTIQTHGRGRSGKSWHSAKGGLWFSIIMRPRIPNPSVRLLQFAAANSVVEAIDKEARAEAFVKWPNDIMFDTQKLGGILLESKIIGEHPSFVVVGVGVNVNQAGENLPEGATSIFARTRHKTPLERLLRSTVEALQENYGTLQNPEKLMSKWWERCQHRSRSVNVQTPEGSVKGVSVGVDNQGRLIMQTLEGIIETVEDGTLRMLE